jgi:UDP-N-acetylglucosamine diphosphorylase/glucosamine-1-phosphate N-acetyltransferase
MDKIIFTEEFCQPENLFPFTLTRQIQDIRLGILTIREKWEKMLKLTSYDKKEDDYKDLGRSVNIDEALGKDQSCYIIHGNLLPTKALVKAIRALKNGEFISTVSGTGIVYKVGRAEITDRYKIKIGKAHLHKEPVHSIQYPWDIFQQNAWAIEQDFSLMTSGRVSQKISRTNKLTGGSKIFLEKGVRMEHCIINASEGPVYIGKNAHVMEGCLLRGPLSIGEGATLKMGSRIYGATTIGPGSIVGGEIKNSVIFGYSNKAHDGYLGDSVIGEWCNMGAGSSNSNLKNNARDIKVWTPTGEINAGSKCGVMMGDYSRTAINTSINTGTIIGVCCNVFGNGLTPKYIPNFSWGSEGLRSYEWEKAIEDISGWKKMKGKELNDEEKGILQYIYRKFE